MSYKYKIEVKLLKYNGIFRLPQYNVKDKFDRIGTHLQQ